MRTLRTLAVVALALLVTPLAEAPLAAQQLAYGQGLLWRIEVPGAPPNYLFGTMHSSDPRVVALPGPVAQALAAARSVTLESRLDSSLAARMTEAMLFRDGRTLPQVAGRDLFQRAVEAFQRYGLGAQQLALFRPWAATMILSLPPAELARRAQGARGLDERLQDEALRRRIPLRALESVDEVIAVFDGLSITLELALFASAIAESARIDQWFEELTGYYLAGNLEAVQGLVVRYATAMPPEEFQAFTARLITARSLRFVKRMKPSLVQGGAFVAVGAMHLPGEQGVLSLLARSGYRVQRLY